MIISFLTICRLYLFKWQYHGQGQQVFVQDEKIFKNEFSLNRILLEPNGIERVASVSVY